MPAYLLNPNGEKKFFTTGRAGDFEKMCDPWNEDIIVDLDLYTISRAKSNLGFDDELVKIIKRFLHKEADRFTFL